MTEQEYIEARKAVIQKFVKHELNSREASKRLKELEIEYRQLKRRGR